VNGSLAMRIIPASVPATLLVLDVRSGRSPHDYIVSDVSLSVVYVTPNWVPAFEIGEQSTIVCHGDVGSLQKSGRQIALA
jgi:hypothetical protein